MYLAAAQGPDLRLRPRGGTAVSSLLTGLVSYWKMDETGGTRADSVVATGNDLTDNNTVASGTGIIGNAGSYVVANSEYLSRANNSTFNPSGDFEFVFWVKLTAVDGGVETIASHGYDANGGFLFDTNNSATILHLQDVFFHWKDSGGTHDLKSGQDVHTYGIADTNWHMIDFYYTAGGEVGIIIDNTGSRTGTSSGAVLSHTASFNVGASQAPGAYWGGLIDEVGFWSRLLTTAQRTSLYNSGAAATYPFTGIP